MHRVDRGAEPGGLEALRVKYTPGWVAWKEGKAERPSDAKWQEYSDVLDERFHTLCGYCERNTKGQVDHFRPLSKFPADAYVWGNWVFACPTCNSAKSNHWPDTGFVDPCAGEDVFPLPEDYFPFDLEDGSILPARSLSEEEYERAETTIRLLQLNGLHHRKVRLQYLELLRGIWEVPPEKRDTMAAFVADRTRMLSSLSRAFLAGEGYPVP